jgi:hypothetical protein
MGPQWEPVTDLGACPTGEHPTTGHRYCGHAGCVDLRVWASARRYRTRLEDSYQAETDSDVKGDGRWYVEVPCRYGLIYPWGGDVLVAWIGSYQARIRLDALFGASRSEGPINPETVWSREYRFPTSRLDEVAAVLKPKRLPGRAATPDDLARLARMGFPAALQGLPLGQIRIGEGSVGKYLADGLPGSNSAPEANDPMNGPTP